MYVRMTVSGLVMDPESKSPVVMLRQSDGALVLPIWIGILEAAAIAYALEGIEPSRPLTHDLVKTLLQELEARVPRVDIDALKDDVFHAKLHLELPGGTRRLIDCRPSDGLAVALRTGAEIFAEERVLQRVSPHGATREPDERQGDAWTDFLANLDPEAFGKYRM